MTIMDKYFICLANSYKHGGRCIAGIEVVPLPGGQLTIVHHNDGRPRWIRPVSMAENGEIPNQLAQGVKLLSLVKLTEVIPCPDKAHTEDVHCSRMECCPCDYEADNNFLSQLIDPVHQAVFYFRGKAIPATMINRLDYSLMLIRPEKASAYIDDEREKSKYRMKFTYYGSNYDFPITDPCFLETFKKNPDRYTNLKGIYLTLSLGLEFEGFHFKLVAAVLPPNLEMDSIMDFSSDKEISYMDQQKQMHPNAYAKWSQEDDALLVEMHKQGASLKEMMTRFERNEGAIRSRLKKLYIEEESEYWFDKYERELTRLLDLKKEVDDRIAALRNELLQQMEIQGEEKVKSENFTVSYMPPRIVMQFNNQLFKEENEQLYRSYCTIFDSKLFREENKELYASYCNKPIQKGASIVVRRKQQDEEDKS